MEAEWNLDTSQVFSSIDVAQISMCDIDEDEKHLATKLRMLILSNQIALTGVPAVLVQTSPDYATTKSTSPVVIVFNCFGTFDESLVPSWGVLSKFVWNPTELFTNEISEHFVRALTLCNYYKMREMKPIFFTSFLLFPASSNILEPFLYQQVPVLKNGSLTLRTVVQDGLQCVVGAKRLPSKGDFLLLPPLNHPVIVNKVDSTSKNVTLLTVDRVTLNLEFPRCYVRLTKPSLVLQRLFAGETVLDQSRRDVQHVEKLCQFKDVDPFSFTERDLEIYFSQRGLQTGHSGTSESDPYVSVLEDPDPTPDQILSEQVSDLETRHIILDCIGRDAVLSLQEPELVCPVSSYLTLFEFDFGFANVSLPRCAKRFMNTSKVSFTKLSVPSLTVNSDGVAKDSLADRIIQNWESDKILPISGEKPCHFVAFCLQNLPKHSVENFMQSLRHAYNQYGFGEMKPMPVSLVTVQPNTIKEDIIRYFRVHAPISEFQKHPVISFVFCDPISDFNPHTILMYVPPAALNSASDIEIRSLTFVIYSRIRGLFLPLNGVREMPKDPADAAICGHRYAPPFLLHRPISDVMEIHIAWDDVTEHCAVVDDVGSILHHFESFKLQNVIELMQSFQRIIGMKLSLMTLTILGEGLTGEQLQTYSEALNRYGYGHIPLFTVAPGSGIQAEFPDNFETDAIVFDSPEQMHESRGQIVQPNAMCYVISQHNPAYKVAIYKGDNPRRCLEDYVTKMSNLTWCSVKPGIRGRTISYPPHVCAVLSKNKSSCHVLSRFEFLPSKFI